MKVKRFLFAGMALVMAFGISLSGCDDKPAGGGEQGGSTGPAEDLNIIDDNNRNWYEVFVREYYDSGDDGVGDIKGVTMKLDYIQEMGFNGIWLMPIGDSTTYHGYDQADYCNVDRDYGTNEDVKELTAEAHKRGINVIVDMVLNHTSSAHTWFRTAVEDLRAGKEEGSRYFDYYNFTKSNMSGYNPVSGTDWYYESRFDKIMPDLNLDNPKVREEIEKILKFWLVDMDCDGFRLDAVLYYYWGQTSKNVEFLKFLKDTSVKYKEDAYIVGECWTDDYTIRQYYNSGCDSFFCFSTASTISTSLSTTNSQPGSRFVDFLVNYQQQFDVGSFAPFIGNHDTSRTANILSGKSRIMMGAGLLALMNGNVFVYYGDEIGMVCSDQNNDPTKRIAMRWADKDMAEGQVYIPPTLGTPMGKAQYPNGSVQSQIDDPSSILSYYKAAMRIRNRHPEIARGTITKLDYENGDVGIFQKTYDGKSITIVLNLSDIEKYTVDLTQYGNLKMTDCLGVFNAPKVTDNLLTMEPYSYVILEA